ncbi:nwd2 [Moniliophthora roreri]|nr:nwd2 [Moniliophthora roreri]
MEKEREIGCGGWGTRGIASTCPVESISRRPRIGLQLQSLVMDAADIDKILAPVLEYTATSTFYDAEQRFPPPKCHPRTRTDALGQ